jgi:hypothetical protein
LTRIPDCKRPRVPANNPQVIWGCNPV